MKRPAHERHESGFFAWYGGGPAYEEPLPPVPDQLHRSGPRAALAPTDAAIRARVGVVLGRFRPPHLGHLHLVQQAFARCGALTVVMARAPALVEDMTADAFADYANLGRCGEGGGNDPHAPHFGPRWAEAIRWVAPRATHVFSSDPVGAAIVARAMGAEHVVIDAGRQTHPISGTAIRGDVFSHFGWIAPGARTHLAVHVGIVGVESAGKTTLARALAQAIGAAVVEDDLRTAAATSGDAQGIPPAWVFGQAITELGDRRRAAAASTEKGVVVVDGCALTTSLWAQRLGRTIAQGLAPTQIDERYDLWILCDDDFGFVGPAERDQPEPRAQMKAALLARLKAQPHVVTLSGPLDGRVQQAVAAIRDAQQRKQQALAKLLG
jgi:HTH-type transcriptional repressor of NAD biosynthesis genes